MSRENDPKQDGSSNSDAVRNAVIRGAVMGITSAVLVPVLGPVAPFVGAAISVVLGNSDDSGAGNDLA